MAALYLKAGRKDLNWIAQCLARFLGRPPTRPIFSTTEPSKGRLLYIPTRTFCMAEDSENSKRNKINYQFQNKIEHIGRKIPHQHVHLIDENCEDMGIMHRADVLRIMDERGLRLVPLREKAEPPVYRLMSGRQIYEERLKLKEKQKAGSKSGPPKMNELRISTNIAQHDLDTKIRQIQKWIDNKHIVRITVQQRKDSDGSEKMVAILDNILASMPGKATYQSEPRVAEEGRCRCVLRPMSEKEIQEYEKKQKTKDNQQDNEKKQKNKEDQLDEKKRLADSDSLKQ
ncbi:hypothetical protein JRQ81_019725 [Phrynocephalus forsythii]|uniref:Translation initiation factor 3 N-terminal domain-containing protein n=1 Tax=Phrynocephalus forsythii TaxID=171643 RepID=A0A9Q1AY90_9SAUR|nr:hypothetical protein JRQ81_019725 [Phrynocephalus forsythii]